MSYCENEREIYFEAITLFGKRIRVTKRYWKFIVEIKHAYMDNKEQEVKEALTNPDEIRQSKKDDTVYLYYCHKGESSICVVCKHLNGQGYIITAYMTDRIKEGEQIWIKKL